VDIEVFWQEVRPIWDRYRDDLDGARSPEERAQAWEKCKRGLDRVKSLREQGRLKRWKPYTGNWGLDESNEGHSATGHR
jgi:hypothetical protein